MTGERSVGLIVMVKLPPGGDYGDEYLAILQRRGFFNTEKMMAETYPNIYQVTVHGKAKIGETAKNAMIRECFEEMGDCFGAQVAKSEDHLRQVYHRCGDNQILIYAIELPLEILSKIRLHGSSGGIHPLRRGAAKFILVTDTGEKHCSPQNNEAIVMFSDEKLAVLSAFSMFN